MPSKFSSQGAEGYEASMGRWSRRLTAPFLQFAGVPSHGRLLDAGCGTGSLTLALAADPTVRAIHALDFEKDFLTALRRRTDDPRVQLLQGDVCALPFADAAFDAVYSLLVLHFVSDPGRAVREMRRVLRPGATAAATVWAYGGLASWRLFWQTVLAHEQEVRACGLAPGKRPLTGEGELRDAFERAGFAGIAETKLTIAMDYADFDDFWLPMVYGQGTFGRFFDGLPRERRNRLRRAVRSAYLGGESDGHRSFAAHAWAVRATTT